MASIIGKKQFDALKNRIAKLEHERSIMAKLIYELVIAREAHGTCLRHELGITPKRAEKYQAMALEARQQVRAAAAPPTEPVATDETTSSPSEAA